jgi:hypothetical protein
MQFSPISSHFIPLHTSDRVLEKLIVAQLVKNYRDFMKPKA